MLVGLGEGLAEDTGARDDDLSDDTMSLLGEKRAKLVYLSMAADRDREGIIFASEE